MQTIINKIEDVSVAALCNTLAGVANLKNNFVLVRLIIQDKITGKFYEYLATKDDKPASKKPSNPGKEKAHACFLRIVECAKKIIPGYTVVATKIYSKRHGVFVNVSYEKCPIDVIEYLISERN